MVGSPVNCARTVAASSDLSLSTMETLPTPTAVEKGVTEYLRMDRLDRSSNDRSLTVSSTMNFAIITRWSVHGEGTQGSGLGNPGNAGVGFDGMRLTRPPPVGTRTVVWEETVGA